MAIVGARGVNTGRPISDVPSGTTRNDVSQREDLASFISMITRDETPFMSSIGKTKATAIFHEWQTDELAAPGNSRLTEGHDYLVPTGFAPDPPTPNVADSITGTAAEPFGSQDDDQIGVNFAGASVAHTGPNRTRLGNYTQINGKNIAISGTRRVLDQAGVADEYAYQLKKRGTELRRDIEFDLVLSFNAASATNSGTAARSMGGFQSWINDAATAIAVGSTALPAAAEQGVGTNVPILSDTKAALSLSDIDQVMQNIYEQGGKANKIMLSPKLRRDFSDLMVTDSGVRRNLDEKGKLRQSVDVYMSDFGDLMVVPNYVMGLSFIPATDPLSDRAAVQVRDSQAFIYDSQWFSIATLRPLQEVDVGQRGDSTIGMMIEEMTLEVKNPIGCGAIYGLE